MQSLWRWLRPPRDLMALFLLVLLVPAAALVVLGLRLLEQDRALEKQRLSELQESAAERVVGSLQQALAATEKHLASLSSWDPPDDAVRVVFHSGGIEVDPPGRLLYYPVLPAGREAPDGPFRQAEECEFQQQDYQKAIVLCRELSSSRDPTVRAGALLRLVRNLRKAGQQRAALDACGQLDQIKSVTLGGIPADLLARRSRCAVLADLGRASELQKEASALTEDLRAGRWHLDRASYIHFSDLACGWLGSGRQPERRREALAAGVEWLWQIWRQNARDEPRQGGRQCIYPNGVALVALWQTAPERLAAMLVGPGYQERNWFSGLTGIAGMRVSLVTAEGRLALGNRAPEGSPGTQRLASETGLPWTVQVTHADPSDALEEFASRRRLLLLGLGLLVILVVAGSYFIWRAMVRELAAAQLQSDFVSAVSHEFRTPLTSLRQFNVLLAGQEGLPEEQRREFQAAQSRATDRLQRLVESLLDFGRMEAGARPYQFKRIDLGALVERVVEEFRGENQSRSFAFRCDTLRAVMNADAEAISRALWNLLDNAAKYSGDSATIEVAMTWQAGSVAISVRDHGPGIPGEERKKIFRKFFRGAYARSHHIRGTGIGLAMVRHIVDAHGGRIELVSTPGEGSTFTILLPVGD